MNERHLPGPAVAAAIKPESRWALRFLSAGTSHITSPKINAPAAADHISFDEVHRWV